MKFNDYVVTKQPDRELFLTMFTTLRPDVVGDTTDVYVYPHWYRGMETTSIRFQLEKEGVKSSVTYNLLSVHVNLLKQKIRESNYEWMLSPNKDLDLSVYSIGSRSYHSLKNNQFLIHPFSLNLSISLIELPIEVMLADHSSEEMKDLTVGDFKHLDIRFQKFASIVGESTKQIHANFRVIQADMNLKRDHDLYFAFNTNLDTLRIETCLTKVQPRLDDGEVVINNTPIDITDFSDWSAMSQVSVQTIINAGENMNERLKAYMEEAGDNPVLKDYAKEMVKASFVMLSQASHQVYKFDGEDGKALVESFANKILTDLEAMEGVVGLDLNSWHLYDYTDPTNVVRIREVAFIDELLDCHTPSFVDALYAHMLNIPDPLLRPYSEIIAVAPEHVKDHAVGSIRVNE